MRGFDVAVFQQPLGKIFHAWNHMFARKARAGKRLRVMKTAQHGTKINVRAARRKIIHRQIAHKKHLMTLNVMLLELEHHFIKCSRVRLLEKSGLFTKNK